jgi:hypothetical protein
MLLEARLDVLVQHELRQRTVKPCDSCRSTKKRLPAIFTPRSKSMPQESPQLPVRAWLEREVGLLTDRLDHPVEGFVRALGTPGSRMLGTS